ncbi:hypothetical protein GLYMA_18G082600v4 [Glycine max]|uniref:Uncharacterized protein n=1 Tax=Glycine max TaxID=3847 RepID=A0A0R0EXW5_SOYBN|nr:hypothetical protein GLYMA_18G082600v4 [Glycine max]
MPAAVTNIAASRSLKIRKVNISGLVTLGSSSSFTSELFGSNQFQKSSASGIFESMFPPPPKVLGRGSLCSEVSGKSSSEGWNSKFDYISMGNHGETQNTAQKDMSSIY